MSQVNENVDVIHLRNGVVISKWTHERLLRLIHKIIEIIDGNMNEEECATETRRKTRPLSKTAAIEKVKQELVQRFIAATFPGPTADVIVVMETCPFTESR